jgi:lauroyl/myristoyl acyltransferase
VRSIYRGSPGAVFAILRELRSGGAVGFLIDLPSRVPSARCRLFGVETSMPLGAARIALARGAAVVVGTAGRDHTIRIRRLDTAGLAGPAGERALQDRLAAELDARIAASPEAWLGLFAAPRPIEPVEPSSDPVASNPPAPDVSLRSPEHSR